MTTLGALLMVKNEEERLPITLKSLIGIIDALIVYDTGSTDNTIKIVQEFCKTKSIPLYLITGEFVDFSTSRNVLLDYADTIDIDYFLILDSNDEVKNGKELREYIKLKNDYYAFYITRVCKTGDFLSHFKDQKLIKRNSGWRFTGLVHEYLESKDESKLCFDPKLSTQIYQDRDKDIEKSKPRWIKDKQILLEEYKNNKTPRTVYYLARTCHCLGERDRENDSEKGTDSENMKEAFEYYKERAETKDDYWEEMYHSMYQCGILSEKWDDKRKWFMDAWELGHRVEPLLRMAEYYRSIKNVESMWYMLKIACNLSFPEDHMLSVNHNDYNYLRWHLLGICGFYYRQWEEGYKGVKKAYEYKKLDIDAKMLGIYSKRNLLVESNISKEEYMKQRRKAGINGEISNKEWEEYDLD